MINPSQITDFNRSTEQLQEFLLFCLFVAGKNKDTPQGKWYSYFEKIFLTFVKDSGKSVAEFDLNIWKEFANA